MISHMTRGTALSMPAALTDRHTVQRTAEKHGAGLKASISNGENGLIPILPILIKYYIITFGGGVWHGPSRGDENAIEDIVTPELIKK